MKILITGATGFIGSAIAHRLVDEQNYEIGCIARNASNKNHIEMISDIANNLSIFYADLTDYSAIKNAVRSFSPHYIIHVGAQTAVRSSFESPHEFNETNYLGTINLIHAALELPNFKKFIFASTMETYGWQENKSPFKEDRPPFPASPYAVSKVACEHYFKMASKAYGLPYLISRACNTYGRKNNAGYIVEHIIVSMLKNKPVYIGTPKAIRDLMYVDDHVSAYLTLLSSDLKNDVFNFSPNNGISMLELAKKIKEKLNYKGKVIEHFPPDYPYRPVTEDYLSLNADKAKKLLGWESKFSLDQGLDLIIEHWRKKLSL